MLFYTRVTVELQVSSESSVTSVKQVPNLKLRTDRKVATRECFERRGFSLNGKVAYV